MKTVIKIACGFLCIVCMFVGVFVFLPKLAVEKKSDTTQNKIILEIWQIDSFEGGTGSRQDFLLKVGRKFEKENTGVLTSVTAYTLSGAKYSIESGKIPDIISYGYGLDVGKIASEINVKNAFSGGSINGKVYALAWCHGAYYLISHDGNFDTVNGKLLVSQAEKTSPLTALAYNGYKTGSTESLLPLNAYTTFLSSKNAILLGTQRDVIRLNRRSVDYKAVVLSGYSDLYQYASVTSIDEVKRIYANEFLRLLVSDDVQKDLTDIGLFSANENIKLYDDELLSSGENAKISGTLNVFLDEEKYQKVKITSEKVLQNTEDVENLYKLTEM